MPDFDGAHDEYVAWRQSALDAYEIFKPYAGIEDHYQAVAIIRNKVKGAARALLVSHNTTLNFDAIMARLDCTYADKTSLRSLKQGLEMVGQGHLSLMSYYDKVERKLTLDTNKIMMSYEPEGAAFLNTEARKDALHAFISGLKRSLKSIVLPAQQKDLPSALALAREAEASIERSIFAATYAKAVGDRSQAGGSKQYGKGNEKPATSTANGKAMDKNPHFTRRHGQRKPPQESKQEPMEVDQSTAKFRHVIPQNRPQTGAYEPSVAKKRQNESERISGQRRQRVNNVARQPAEDPNKSYAVVAERKMTAIDNEQSDSEDEQLNFLGDGPNCRLYSGSWLAKH